MFMGAICERGKEQRTRGVFSRGRWIRRSADRPGRGAAHRAVIHSRGIESTLGCQRKKRHARCLSFVGWGKVDSPTPVGQGAAQPTGLSFTPAPFESTLGCQRKKRHARCLSFGMGEGGFEPPKAVPADLQSVPFGHSGIPPYSVRIGSRRTLGYYSTPVRVCQEVSGKKSELFIRSRRTLAILREICYNEANGNPARRETEVDAWNPGRSSISRASR